MVLENVLTLILLCPKCRKSVDNHTQHNVHPERMRRGSRGYAGSDALARSHTRSHARCLSTYMKIVITSQNVRSKMTRLNQSSPGMTL